MKEVNGWWLPEDDNYFVKFIVNQPVLIAAANRVPHKENGFQREHLMEAFKRAKKFDYAVDVGAHVGFWAKDMAGAFGHVYCFEPCDKNFSCLEKNMAEYDNVSIKKVAVGDKERTCDIARDDERLKNSGSEYVRVSGGLPGHIDMIALDNLILPGCDLLKVDVEGFEYAVLQGARRLIKRYKPVVIMETGKKFAKKRYGWPDDRAEWYLEAQGYKKVAYMRPDSIFVPNNDSA